MKGCEGWDGVGYVGEFMNENYCKYCDDKVASVGIDRIGWVGPVGGMVEYRSGFVAARCGKSPGSGFTCECVSGS